MAKDFEGIGRAIGKLVGEKNEAYGESYACSGDVLKILYPQGVSPEQYQDMLGVVRVIDKLFRVANDKGAFEESPWGDICGYGILGVAYEKKKEIVDTYASSRVRDV